MVLGAPVALNQKTTLTKESHPITSAAIARPFAPSRMTFGDVGEKVSNALNSIAGP
jgi:hypothetical protein